MKNFGLIREGYYALMIDGINTKDKNKINTSKSFIREVKKNDALLIQNNTYDLLERVSDVGDEFKDMYVNEALNNIREYDTEKLIEANVKLLEPLLEYGVDISKIDYSEKKLHESITTYLYNDRVPKTFATIVEAKNTIINHKSTEIISEVDESKIIPPSTIYMFMMETMAHKYPNLKESEAKVVASLLLNDKDMQKNLFETFLSEAKEYISNYLLNEEYSNISEQLTLTKEKLDGMVYNESTYIDDVNRILSLKN